MLRKNTKRTAQNFLWISWFLASIFYAYQYILRVLPNIMFNEFAEQFNIGAGLFGQFSGVYYIGYALMHLPIGILLDRFGPKKIMFLCILSTVIGMMPILYSHNWILALAGRTLVGIGSSAAILGTFKIIRMTFEERYFTRMLSFSVTIGLLGAIYGGGPVAYLSKIFGYQSVIFGLVIMGIILSCITYIMVPTAQPVKQKSIKEELFLVLKNPRVIMICLFAGMMVGPLEGFADVWGAEFFKIVYDIDKSQSSYLISMIFIGMCFGAPVLSLIAEKTNNYFGVIIGASFLMCIVFSFLLYFKISINIITISFILVGVCCAYQILAIYKASSYVPEHVVGITTAIANMIIMIFGYVFHTVIGAIIEVLGGVQNKTAFIYGISIIPITLLISMIGFLLISYNDRKKFPKTVVRH